MHAIANPEPANVTRYLLFVLLSVACASSTPDSGMDSTSSAQMVEAEECHDWQAAHPDWLFCDDFESTGPFVAQGRYFEYGAGDHAFVPLAGTGLGASVGMRTRWQAGQVGAGGFKLAFGRNPNSYMNQGRDFREIYYRMYLRQQPGWQGNPAKLSRATVFTSKEDWSQAMIAHLWSDSAVRAIC